jgi:hypothetical protein
VVWCCVVLLYVSTLIDFPLYFIAISDEKEQEGRCGVVWCGVGGDISTARVESMFPNERTDLRRDV